MPAPIGEKSLKYRTLRKKPASLGAIACLAAVYITWLAGFTGLCLVASDYGGVIPLLRATFSQILVPFAGTVLGPAASCAAYLGSAASYVADATLSLQDSTSNASLLGEAAGSVLLQTGALEVAEGVSVLQHTTAAQPLATQGMKVLGGKLSPPFRPQVRKYQVQLDDQLLIGCDSEGCPGGAPDIEVELSLRRAGNVRVGQEVLHNVSGTVRRRVPLSKLFWPAGEAQGRQQVVVQVRDPTVSKRHAELYILDVLRPSEMKERQPRVERKLAARADVDGAVILDALPADKDAAALPTAQPREEQVVVQDKPSPSLVKVSTYTNPFHDVRCGDGSDHLYWGNCDGDLCTQATCQAQCSSDDSCKFYAIWNSGHCETYASCESQTKDGRQSIEVYEKDVEATKAPTTAPTQATNAPTSASCTDSSDGPSNAGNMNCGDFAHHPASCASSDESDDEDFTASIQCCACVGALGPTPVPTQASDYTNVFHDVRCGEGSDHLYWGNCDGDLCTQAACEAFCASDEKCWFYAIWTSGHCETYAKCASQTDDFGQAIEVYQKPGTGPEAEKVAVVEHSYTHEADDKRCGNTDGTGHGTKRLYWGNCEGFLCSRFECEEHCTNDEQCQYYASWTSGHCETYSTCGTQEADGGMTIELWKKKEGPPATETSTTTTPFDIANYAAYVNSEVLWMSDTGNKRIVLKAHGGFCEQRVGIFEEGMKDKMNFWSANQKHILCFPDKRGKKMKLEAKHLPTLAAKSDGEFGFGPGVMVGLRPNIETEALWSLEDGVIGLPLQTDPIKLMGVRMIMGKNEDPEDTPLVMATSRMEWPIDVNFMDESQGECVPIETVAGKRRFACRAVTPKTEVSLMVICDICSMNSGSGGKSMVVQQEQMDAMYTIYHGHGDDTPWLGYKTTSPATKRGVEPHPSGHAFYTIQIDGEDDVYEVGLVSGSNRRLPWDNSNIPPPVYEMCGSGIKTLMWAALWHYALVLLMHGMGLPAPSLAGLPTLTAAFAVLQLLAILGRETAEPPIRIESFSLALPPVEKVKMIGYSLLTVFACRGLAVARHVFRNGEGAAEYLPHGLVTGAWELRAFNIFVLPLAYKAATFTLVFAIPEYSNAPGYSVAGFVEVLWGCGILLLLLAVPIYCVMKIRSAFSDQMVVSMFMPGTSNIIFVDRTCDQLRAIPMDICRTVHYSRLDYCGMLTFFTKSAGWMYSPTTCAIGGIEHRGNPTRDSVAPGSVKTVYETGPWGKAGAVSKQEAVDDDLSKLPEDRPQSSSAADEPPAASGLKSQKSGMMPAQTDIGFWYGTARKNFGDPASSTEEKRPKFTPVQYAHPIRVVTNFVYMGAGGMCRLAGVAGLPWLDCAVPAKAMENLEFELSNVELRVHAGQMSGPITSGRIGACFDWTDSTPYRYPVEVFVKIAFGMYLAALPYTASYSAPFFWYIMHIAVVSGLAILGFMTLCNGPHTAVLDNLALASSIFAACAGVFMYLGGQPYEAVGPVAALAVIFLIGLPVVLFLLTSVMLFVLSLQCVCLNMTSRVVPAIVQDWAPEGPPPPTAKASSSSRVAPGYSRLEGSADADEGAPAPSAGSLPTLAIYGASMVPLDNALLPARSKCKMSHYLLRTAAGSFKEDRVDSPTLPLEARFLFAQKSGGVLVRHPFGALLTEDKGLLLFEKPHLNDGGMMWEDVIQSNLGKKTPISKRAIDILQEAASSAGAGEEAGTYQKMVVIEVKSDTA